MYPEKLIEHFKYFKDGEFYYFADADGGSLDWSGGKYGNRFSVNHPDKFEFTFKKNPSDDYVTESFRKLEYSNDNGWTKNVNFSRSNADKQKKREVNTEDDNTSNVNSKGSDYDDITIDDF